MTSTPPSLACASLGDRFNDAGTYYLVKAVKKRANAQITSEVLYQLDCERRTV